MKKADKNNTKGETNMAYDKNSFAEAKKPVVGERIDAVITTIEEATLAEFIPAEAAKKWENFDGKIKAIKITAMTSDNRTFHKVLTLPADPKNVNAKSNFARWKKVYADWPHPEQKVFLLADDNGFFNFLV